MSLDLAKLKILIVDDMEQVREVLSMILDRLSVGKILKAASGKDAFEIFCEEEPDLIISDWAMKPMDGIELTKKIRTDQKSPNIFVPIIMLTGYAKISRVKEARDAGVTEFLVKPFTAKDLAQRIEHIINEPRDFVFSEQFMGPSRRRNRLETDPKYKGKLRREDDNDK